MKLSDKALAAITTRARTRLALALDCSIHSVDRWIKENEDNGSLTKSMSLQIISQETGLPFEEILSPSDVKEVQDNTVQNS